MTKLLEEAIAKARTLPEDEQDTVAEVMLSVVDKNWSEYQLTAEQIEQVRRIKLEIQEGRAIFATDQEMAALWTKASP
jgi:hypothetical protein